MPSVAQRPSQGEIDELLASLPNQPLHAAVIATGNRILQGTWGAAEPFEAADAFEAMQVIARAAGVDVQLRNAECLPWHPGRCAEVLVDDISVGFAGELHPQVCERADLPPRTIAVEIDLSALPIKETFPRPTISAFPPVYQDVALVVDESIPVATIEDVLREGAGELLESIRLFDIYESDALGEGKHSLTFSLSFRATDRTLTEDEASEGRRSAIEAAKSKLGAELRS